MLFFYVLGQIDPLKKNYFSTLKIILEGLTSVKTWTKTFKIHSLKQV